MKFNKFLPYIVIGVPLLIGGFFIYKYVASKKKGQDSPPIPPSNSSVEPITSGGGGGGGNSGGVRPSVSKYFPLRRGSKGGKVKELQQALLNYDSTILPKYGADSDFGRETENAVIKVLGKSTVDSQEDIDSIVKKTADKKNTEKAKTEQSTADSNRAALAKTLVDEYKKSPYVNDFYAINSTTVVKGNYTSDGRVINDISYIYTQGMKLGLSRKAEFTIRWNGYIGIKDGDKYFGISPYGFEVK